MKALGNNVKQVAGDARGPYEIPKEWEDNIDKRKVGVDPGSRDLVTGAVNGDSVLEPNTIRLACTGSTDRCKHQK